MDFICEPERNIPVIEEADVCICGGSCTGLFAAVRAARLGCSVVLCEETNVLGGVAVNGLVNVWHTLWDIHQKEQIIAGLTEEMLERLKRRDALYKREQIPASYHFNPAELAFELDRLAAECNIRVRLHTKVCGVSTRDGAVDAVFIEDQDGRGAIRAGFFIDCTGDGDVMKLLSMPCFTNQWIQPPSACCHLLGELEQVDIPKLVSEHAAEFGLENDWGWSSPVAGCPGLTMRADHHVFGVRCDRAADLTRAEQIGRSQMRGFLDLLRKYGRSDTHYAITNIASYIGVRETVHYTTKFKAERLPLFSGAQYPDVIAKGTYPSDVHHGNNMGITFWYLDGTRLTSYGRNTRMETGNWREEHQIKGAPAAYYQVPFSILVQERWRNLIPAGRMLNADSGAFGALRVMVNLNQMGEAAGCAAAICLQENRAIYEIDGCKVRALLKKGGSAL